MEKRRPEKCINSAPTKEYVSRKWWLMPIFLGWIGGLIAWLVNKKKEPSKARSMLIVGLALSAVGAIIGLVGVLKGADELLVYIIITILAGLLAIAMWITMIVAAYTLGKMKSKPWLGLTLGIFLGWIGVIIMATLPYPYLTRAPVMENRRSSKEINKALEALAKEYVAGEWWLMPIFLGWVGGLIAWLVNKKKEPAKARSMFFVGLALSAAGAIISLALVWEGTDVLLRYIIAILAGIFVIAFWIIMIVVASIIGKMKGKLWLGLILGGFLGLIGVIIMATLPYPYPVKAPAG